MFLPCLTGGLALGGGSGDNACLPAQGLRAVMPSVFLVPPLGSVFPASHGDTFNPLVLCSGPHFHFILSLFPTRSMPLDQVPSRKPSLPTPGHSELSPLTLSSRGLSCAMGWSRSSLHSLALPLSPETLFFPQQPSTPFSVPISFIFFNVHLFPILFPPEGVFNGY